MTLLWTESFDGNLTGTEKWSAFSAANTVNTTFGRNSTNGMKFSQANSGIVTIGNVSLPLSDRVTVGCWAYGDERWDGDDAVLQLRSTTNSFVDVKLNQTVANWQWRSSNVANTAIGPPGSGQRFTWNFIEMQAQFGSYIEIRANNEVILSQALGGTGQVNMLQMVRGGGLAHSGCRYQVDDIYVLNSVGTTNNTFLGPIHINSLQPTGNGTRSDLVGDDADSTDNYLRVNDNSDATYVEGDPTQGDTYAFENLANTEDVYGVVEYFRGYDALGGAVGVRGLAVSGGNEYEGPAKVLPGGALTHIQAWDVDPDTGTAWTTSAVDAAEFGVEFA